MLQNELLVIVLHPIEQILQALKLYEIIGHTKGLEWTLFRSLFQWFLSLTPIQVDTTKALH